MNDSPYNSGQFRVVFPHLKGITPEWLILGGPADGDEAQTALKKWPILKVLGIEPCQGSVDYQHQNGWPEGAPLVTAALSDHLGLGILHSPQGNPRNCSLMVERGGASQPINLITLDQLNIDYGPFKRVILWMDIEGVELEALRGAENLFSSGEVLLCNVEILERRKKEAQELEELMKSRGYVLAQIWNSQPGLCEDRIYIPRDLYQRTYLPGGKE